MQKSALIWGLDLGISTVSSTQTQTRWDTLSLESTGQYTAITVKCATPPYQLRPAERFLCLGAQKRERSLFIRS